MSEPVSTKSAKENSRNQSDGHARRPEQQATVPGPQAHILGLQRAAGNQAVNRLLQTGAGGPSSADGQAQAGPEAQAELVRRAGAEPGRPLDESVRAPMEQALGKDLGGVRLHAGPAAAAASESLDASAYTVGSDIYLGPEARRAGVRERNRLLAHEVVHTVQQGGRSAALQGKMRVSRPNDGAEVEADRVAESVMSAAAVTPSPALALRNQLRVSPVAAQTVSRVAAPTIQRHLKGKYPSLEGDFHLNLKTEKHPGAKSGMSGTIKFKANDKAPDSTSIRLLQTVRLIDLSTNKDYVWTGDEADRNKTQTKANKATGLEGGWFVDHSAAMANPRTAKADAAVSPYYRDYWPNAAESQDGSKKGKSVSEASLWDFPGWSRNCTFTFETVAQDSTNGHYFGSVFWTFTISDAAKGEVTKEGAYGRHVTLLATDEAVKAFNEFYKNPGASTAPKK